MEGTTVMNDELDPMPDDAESGPLSNLTIVELRGLWRQLYGSEPQPSINRSLLIRRIACRSQEPARVLKSANRGLLARVNGFAGAQS